MGGWASDKTQETIITPKIVQTTIHIIKAFETKFNEWSGHYIQFVAPVGSAAYYIKDLNTDAKYGDIDYLVEFPYIKGKFKSKRDHENATLRFYKQKLMEFIQTDIVDNIEVADSLKSNGNFLIFRLPNNKFIQVDIVATTPKYTNWNIGRFTPEYGMKGVIIGSLYTALNELYNINIGDRGLTLRWQHGKLVSGKIRKDVKIETISTIYEQYWFDLIVWMARHRGTGIIQKPMTSAVGVSSSKPTLSSIMKGLAGFLGTLEKNNLLNNDIFPESTSKEIIKKIYTRYIEILNNILKNPKYDKAINQNKIELIKHDIARGKWYANDYLFRR